MSISYIVYLVCFVTGLVWAFSVVLLLIGLIRMRFSISERKPTISVLVAARNEEGNISRLLDALQRQDYPEDLRDFIIIDDNSTDRTAEIVNGYLGKIRGLKLINAGEPESGLAPKKSALKRGISTSKGEIIITTDADCVPPPTWLDAIATYFTPETNAVVGFSPLRGKGLAGAVTRFDGLVNAVISAGSLGIGFPTSAAGRNFAYRREAWEDVGGFGKGGAGASGDDDLLLQRFAALEGRIAFASDPASFVPAKGQPTLGSWLRMKRRHYSAGKRYKPGLVLFATILYLFNLSLLMALVGVIAFNWNGLILAAIWTAKVFLDGVSLWRGAILLRVKRWQLEWLIAEMISPLIFSLLIPASLSGKIRWKDRVLGS